MGSLYRSEEMTLCQLFLQSESAYNCVSELGELGLVQFRDLNPDVNAFQRKFVNEVRRCDEMERKLRFFEKEMKKDGIVMMDVEFSPFAPAPRQMTDLEATFSQLEKEMKEVTGNAEALKKNYLELTELRHILRKTQTFFEEAEQHYDHKSSTDQYQSEESLGLLGNESLLQAGHALRLGFLTGVVLRERMPAFERMLWRACRGNVFLKQAEIETPLEDPVTGNEVSKSVFIIFFQGDQLKTKVKKICEGFHATLYPCPETSAERREMAIGVMTRREDLSTVLSQTQDHRCHALLAMSKNIKEWFIKVRKIKAIYHTLNMLNLDVTQKCLIGECWCPVADLEKIQLALRRGTQQSGSSVPSILNHIATKQPPPTYNRTNKFTEVFQGIVDAYGVASYREVNAAPFAIISFPFLFSMMFGDAGHAVIMLLFAFWMVKKEKQLGAEKSDNEIWNIFFGGRYIILLMGIFSIYSGILYNDVFSKSVNVFGTTWNKNLKQYNLNKTVGKLIFLEPDPRKSDFTGVPYPFGIDPVWQLTNNKITFLNSYKMKISVIFGIAQMTFGVILSFFNHRYFRRPLNIFCEFIPEMIFMMAIFGYLIILMFYKWLAKDASKCAPSILINLINMFLMNYKEERCSSEMLYNGAKPIQILLVLIALLCVPWMLLVKPLLLRRQHLSGKLTFDVDIGPDQPEESIGLLSMTEEEEEVVHYEVTPHKTELDEEEEKFDFSEVLIHQTIHTIEYCLGCISHTASYLRLWALSLAHAQLSEVLWSMVFRIGLSTEGATGAILTFFVFAPWAVLTVGVLLLMEGLSAFLHTLRLHWVEFQSKFYKGEGHKFQPLSFEMIIQSAEECS